MSGPGFWLRVNGQWMPLHGVQSGVQISPKRNRSTLQVVGGLNYEYQSRRAAREWSLDFSHATPESLRLLALAANDQAGDVMLLDASAARANMLDPLMCVGVDANPLLDCDGLPLRSIVSKSTTTEVVSVPLSANAVILASSPNAAASYINLQSSPAIESLVKVNIPTDPAGREFVSARLSLTRLYTPVNATITARAASNSWVEGVTWNTAPAGGASVGSGSPTNGRYSIAISGVDAYRGAAMSLRLTSNSPSFVVIDPRTSTLSSRPRLEITYSVTVTPQPFSAAVRAGQPYTLTAYTDATAGTPVLTYNLGGSDVVVNAPFGAGTRLLVASFTPSADVTLVGAVSASAAALRLTEGEPMGAWVPGHKTPVKVAVSDPEQVLNYVLDGQQGRSNYSVAIREVG